MTLCRAFGQAVPEATIIEAQGRVEFAPGGTDHWHLAGTNQVLYPGDVVRTGPRSGATLQLRGQSVLNLRELSVIRIEEKGQIPLLRLLRGLLYFFDRDRPDRVHLEGGWVSAAILGTEFAFGVDDADTATLTLFDGAVRLRNAQGELSMSSGDIAVARPGEPPRATARLMAGDFSAIQWAVYYPSILDLSELGEAMPVDPALDACRELYRLGNLPRALAIYPAGRTPTSDGERLWLAALLLSVGGVTEAESLLQAIPTNGIPGRLAAAHRRLISAVLHRDSSLPVPVPHDSPLAGECLTDAYLLQLRFQLAQARDAALQATRVSPRFSFAWVRLAELEFTLGNLREARAAVEQALSLSPQNAEAHALHGFLLAARNRTREAQDAFDRALSLDGALGNAWLGRGLCRIRRGDLVAGRRDLQVAAAVEPQRSLLRSYLGKAFADSVPFRAPAESDLAQRDLALARGLDPHDPTPWLYSALLRQQNNRVNEAITDLQESLALNDRRSLYRSRLGLDQDRAVRSANLARLFSDAGFPDLGLREATRAVNADYANGAAHLYLANSYDALRDPRQVNLRYETPWYSEYLVANLLAPVGAGSLSQTVAQNEYSRLFERDRAGLVNATTWTSNGDWHQQAAQYGQFGDLAYALDLDYRAEVGLRPYQDLEWLSFAATTKFQVTPDDSLLVQARGSDADSGDVLQRYDAATAVPGLRFHEHLEPLGLVGWHHQWRPGVHTLFLISSWNASQNYVNPSNQVPWFSRDATGAIESGQFRVIPLVDYESRLTGVSTELQQLWQTDSQTLVAGARYQNGGFDTTARLNLGDFEPDGPAQSEVDPGLARISVYAYDHWQLGRAVLLTTGITYDRLTRPRNFRTAPLTDGTDTLDCVLPKLGLTVRPWTNGTLRASWSRSLGGVSFDQSVRIEPVQVAGFSQAYRGLIPESLVGSVAGQEMESFGVAFDQVLTSRTWFTIAAEQLGSTASRDVGAFAYGPDGFEAATSLQQDLEFTERSLGLTLGQLVGRDLSLILRYRLSEAELKSRYPELADDPAFSTSERSILHQLSLGARYQHPAGFFASWESRWTRQSNHGDASRYDGDDFWQHDLWLGWRFWQRRAELAVGLLNLTDEDYRLYPLNDFRESCRERTVAVSGRFAF